MVRSIQSIEAEIAEDLEILRVKREVCDEMAQSIAERQAALDDMKRSREHGARPAA